jgi:hypothetical protein
MKVDICFLMDITGSMGPWIQAAKDHIFDIVRKTQQDTPTAEVRVAFVGYRDYGDIVRYVYKPFGNVDDILDAIQNVRAEGGDDQAEDVAGGLLAVDGLDWEEDAAKTLIHIADAPPHGRQFHEPWISDRFLEGDPENKDPAYFMGKFCEENIDYTFIKINDSTNIMVKDFHNVYTGPGQFEVVDLRPQVSGGVDDFAPAVFRTLSDTITRYSASQDPSKV